MHAGLVYDATEADCWEQHSWTCFWQLSNDDFEQTVPKKKKKKKIDRKTAVCVCVF